MTHSGMRRRRLAASNSRAMVVNVASMASRPSLRSRRSVGCTNIDLPPMRCRVSALSAGISDSGRHRRNGYLPWRGRRCFRFGGQSLVALTVMPAVRLRELGQILEHQFRALLAYRHADRVEV